MNQSANEVGEAAQQHAESRVAGEPVTDSARFPVGTVVGARRWPYASAHPECWGTPWSGVVLEMNDPRVWSGNPALSSQEKIGGHIAWCKDRGLLMNTVPVLWDFAGEQVVYFQSATGDARCHDLKPYAEDYLAWQSARAAAFRKLASNI
jgi:hypothetical protein